MTARALHQPHIPIEVSAMTSPSMVRSKETCSTCATIKKSGVLSCCARGGTWFKNCGDESNTQFAHTWSEGIQACKAFAISFALNVPLEDMIRHVEVYSRPIDSNKPRNNTQQQTDNYRSIGISNAENSKLEGRVGLSQVFVCISILLNCLRSVP